MITVELVALNRSRKCRLLRHRACQVAYRSSRAVRYVESTNRRIAVAGWLRCPCPCHGDLPAAAEEAS